MKVVQRVRLSLLVVLMAMAIALAGFGAGMLVRPAHAEDVTDVYGWSNKVTREGKEETVTLEKTDDYYAKYTNLKGGSVLAYQRELKSGKQDSLIRTTPYAISLKAVGKGSVTLQLLASKDGTDTAVWQLFLPLEGETSTNGNVGGNFGLNSVPYKSGDTLTFVVDGHHMFGSSVYMLDGNGKLAAVGSTDGNTWTNAGSPESYKVKIVVGDSSEVSELDVKIGEGLNFVTVSNFDWSSAFENIEEKIFEPDTFDNGAYLQYILQPANSENCPYTLWAFKGFPVSFRIKQGENYTDEIPHVTVGGVSVNSDGEAGKTAWGTIGWFNYTVSPDAESAALKVVTSTVNVKFVDGSGEQEEVLYSAPAGTDGTVTRPEDGVIKKMGKVVEDYYKDKDCQQKFSFEDKITQTTTIYVKWKEVPYVEYVVGDATYDWQNFEEGHPVKPDRPKDPTNGDKGFVGWFEDADGNTPFDFEQECEGAKGGKKVYAVFGYMIELHILGYDSNGENYWGNVSPVQIMKKPVKDGGSLTAETMPTFSEITGLPAYDSISVKWYTDEAVTTEVKFPYEVTGNGALYGLALDTDDATKYVEPDPVSGWDNVAGVKNQDTKDANNGPILLHDDKYGTFTTKIRTDIETGYSTFDVNMDGYLANTRKFDVTKDIYLDFKPDVSPDGTFNVGDPVQRYFLFSIYNSLTNALTADGPQVAYNSTNLGKLGEWGFNLRNSDDAVGEKKANTLETWGNWATPVEGAFHIGTDSTANDGKGLDTLEDMIHFIIRIGEKAEDSGVFVKKDGEEQLTKVVSLKATRAMFPNGLYVVVSAFRNSVLTVRATQESTIKQVTDEKGSFTLDKTEGLAGDKITISDIKPADGYVFSESSLYVGGEQWDVVAGENGVYYFNMPFGTDVPVEIRWAQPTKVEFWVNGEVFTTLDKNVGEKIRNTEIPETEDIAAQYEGYVLEGWYLDEACTQKFDRNTNLVTENMKLYAKQHTEHFDDDGDGYCDFDGCEAPVDGGGQTPGGEDNPNQGDNAEEGGCGSVVGFGILFAVLAAGAVALVLVRKKKE